MILQFEKIALRYLTVDGSGSKFFDPVWVGSGQPSMILVLVWKISPKNVKFFNFSPSDQKKSLRVGSKSTWVKGGSASYLLWVKSKLGLGRVSSGKFPYLVLEKSLAFEFSLIVHLFFLTF